MIDANNQVLGKIAVDAANLLRGRHKVEFQNHLDIGDMVVIINAASVKLTGNKNTDKEYHHHSSYPGGLKTTTAGKLLETNPIKIIESAISGMLPKNKLRASWMKRLRVYAGSDHPHAANISKEQASTTE